MPYFVEPRTRKYVKGCGFLSFARNLSNKYWKQLLDAGINAWKTANTKVIHKAAEATGEFLGNKIANKIVKPSINLEEIINRLNTGCYSIKIFE